MFMPKPCSGDFKFPEIRKQKAQILDLIRKKDEKYKKQKREKNNRITRVPN